MLVLSEVIEFFELRVSLVGFISDGLLQVLNLVLSLFLLLLRLLLVLLKVLLLLVSNFL